METIKRRPIVYKFTKQQQEWLDNNCCPICGLPKNDWKRRTDWRCCSTNCTKKFSEVVVFIWQYFKEDAFKRDNYKCIKCGFAPIRTSWDGSIVGDTSKLIGDHIIPIALGGEEYDLDNVQTLCIECNKIKTKKDMQQIALYRKQSVEQSTL